MHLLTNKRKTQSTFNEREREKKKKQLANRVSGLKSVATTL